MLREVAPSDNLHFFKNKSVLYFHLTNTSGCEYLEPQILARLVSQWSVMWQGEETTSHWRRWLRCVILVDLVKTHLPCQIFAVHNNRFTRRYGEMFLNSLLAWLQQKSRRCNSIVWPVVWIGSARERGSFRVCLISTTCLPVTSVSLPRSSVERRRGWRRVWSKLTHSDLLVWLWNCLSFTTVERGKKKEVHLSPSVWHWGT